MTSGFERCSYCSIFYVLGGGDNRLYCSLLDTDCTSLLSRYSAGQRSRHRLFVCWKHCLHGRFSTVEPSLKGTRVGYTSPVIQSSPHQNELLYIFMGYQIPWSSDFRSRNTCVTPNSSLFFHSTLWLQFAWKLVWRQQLGLKWVVFGIISFSMVHSCMQSLPFNPWGNNKYYTVVLFRILQVKLF